MITGDKAAMHRQIHDTDTRKCGRVLSSVYLMGGTDQNNALDTF